MYSDLLDETVCVVLVVFSNDKGRLSFCGEISSVCERMCYRPFRPVLEGTLPLQFGVSNHSLPT